MYLVSTTKYMFIDLFSVIFKFMLPRAVVDG